MTGQGGNEVLEGLLLGPIVRSYARHLSRELTLGLLLDHDKVDFFVHMVITHLEALDALASRNTRPPPEAHLGPYDTRNLECGVLDDRRS